MAKIKIALGNWTTHLAYVIECIQPGDVIVVDSPEKAELAELAAKRMGKEIAVEIDESLNIPWGESDNDKDKE